MSSVNKVIILGNLGRDPDVKYTTSGIAACTLAIATSRSWKNKDTGERQEETEWHRVVLFERLSEIAVEYLKKGKPVYIEGRLKTRKWADKDGVERYTTEIIGAELVMLGGREDGDAGQPRQPAARPAPAPAPVKNSYAAAKAGQAPPRKTSFDDMADDVPF